MAEQLQRTGRTPEEHLSDLRDAVSAGDRDPRELADLAIGAVGDPANVTDVDAFTARLDEVLELGGGSGVLGQAMLGRITELMTASRGGGLSAEQSEQLAVINALAERTAAVKKAAAAAASGTASASATAAAAAPPPTATTPPDPAATNAKSAAWRQRQGDDPRGPGRPRRSAKGAGPVPGSKPNTAPGNAAEAPDTLTPLFKSLLARAQWANKQRGNGHSPETTLSVDEKALLLIIEALDVDQAVELPITADRTHPETKLEESVEDSAAFIVEARQLYEELVGRPVIPRVPRPGFRFTEYKGPGDTAIRAEIVDRLGELTDYSHWIVGADTRDDFQDRYRQLMRAGADQLAHANGYTIRIEDDDRGRLMSGFLAAGNNSLDNDVMVDPLIRVTRYLPDGKTAAPLDQSNPSWKLDRRLIEFHQAQMEKRMELSNLLRIMRFTGSIVASQPGDTEKERLENMPADDEVRIQEYTDGVYGGYEDWIHHLYDAIELDDVLIGAGSPVIRGRVPRPARARRAPGLPRARY